MHYANFGFLIPFLILLIPYTDSKPPGSNPTTERSLFKTYFHDGHSFNFTLKDDQIPLTTPQGKKLVIPVAEIWRIDFAFTRIPEDIRKQIGTKVSDLGNPDFMLRETATKDLRQLGERAYSALLPASKDKDPEVAFRAKSLLDSLLNETLDEDITEKLAKHDVIYLKNKMIVGWIEVESLKARTNGSNELQLKLTDLRTLQSPMVDPVQLMRALPDPGTLSLFRNQVGKILVFKVKGGLYGELWGTDIYSDESRLAAAAIHAGLVQVGQTKKVRVKILGPQPKFRGSPRNGILSENQDSFGGSYQFVQQ